MEVDNSNDPSPDAGLYRGGSYLRVSPATLRKIVWIGLVLAVTNAVSMLAGYYNGKIDSQPVETVQPETPREYVIQTLAKYLEREQDDRRRTKE